MDDEAEQTTGPAAENDPTSPTAESDDLDQDPVTDDDLADSPEQDQPEPRSRLSVRARNAVTIGVLTLHYAARDVSVYLDGASAMRALAMYHRRAELGMADRLDGYESDAGSGWMIFELDEPLAMSWTPGLPAKPRRTAIDPVAL
jgi:hypothetical protein